MKLPKLMLQDYLVAGAVIFILVSAIASDGVVQTFFYVLWTAVVLFILYKVGKSTFQVLRKDGFEVFIKEIISRSLWAVVYCAIYITFFTLMWVALNLAISTFNWVRYGSWLYQHYDFCRVIGFNCYPDTGFVKINELLGWLYELDIELWLIAIPWLMAYVLWLLDAPKDKD